ncbi:MAG: hypothetical protein QOE70_4228 [Chthoniobacter sp.]|jgi:hypothetical protein|nr:hypothetical protein [Chthoniobacter sp.]
MQPSAIAQTVQPNEQFNTMITELRRQLSVAIENEPGRLGQIGRLLAVRGIHIDAFSVIDNVEQGMVRLMTSDPAAARAALKEGGLPVVEAEVLAVEMSDRVGNLAAVGEALAAAGINIEYAYASTAEIGQPARLILRTTSPQKAREVLAAVGDS